MKYLALDPSFSKSGLCVFDVENKKVLFKPIVPPGKNATFKEAIGRSTYVALEVLKELDLSKTYKLILEEPMVSSMMASRLGLLSGVVTTTFLYIPHITHIYTINPITITSLNSAADNKAKLNKKQLSLSIAMSILEHLESTGYDVTLWTDKHTKDGSPKKRKLSHDEAESFLMVLLLLKQDNQLPYETWVEIYKINKGFYTKDIKINKLKENVFE